jgi:hypothetical protein
MGIRRYVPLLLAVAVASACTEQQDVGNVTGLQSAKPTPPPAAACDPSTLNSLINGYFPGSRTADIKDIKDDMIAAVEFSDKRDFGFALLDSIGQLSRTTSVDTVAGSNLTQGIIKCMFDASLFTPAFPTDAVYNFAPALSKANGGAFFVRGAGLAGTDTVVGATFVPLGGGTDITVLSGITPPSGSSWTSVLAGNTASEGRVLLYGRLVSSSPFVYEWATIPPAATFSPGAIVAVCDDNTASNAMVHETNVGLLQFSSGNAICGANVPLVMEPASWSPRWLASRLARTLLPAPLQAAVALKSGSGGTVTTAKSLFSTKPVSTVRFEFVIRPPKKIFLSGDPATIQVRATANVDGVPTGVNGTCVYVVGSENNGANFALDGTHECGNEPPGAISAITESRADGSAGYATLEVTATKTGGATLTATAEDATGTTGVIGRDGQVFINATAKTTFAP